MLVRLAILLGVLLALGAAWALWQRPPRRLAGGDLIPLGVTEPAVVQFTSPACAPCRTAAPHLRRAADREGMPYLQVDVAERPELAAVLGIRTVPTIAVTGAGGRVVEVWTALPPPAVLAEATRRARSA
ncbi:MAG TPA: thioredoxin family protein [Actinomycetota bacterium]|nr:thioredoxin family protein [Actinomycetota bacterium]